MSKAPNAPALYQHLRGPQDTNGNPRRCFVVYDSGGNILEVIDEGYAGRPKHLRMLAQLPDVVVSANEYRAFLRADPLL